MLKTSPIKQLNNEFYRFQLQISQSRVQNIPFFLSQLNKYEKQYKRAGLGEIFMQKLFEFAQNMQKFEIKDLPGIIFSHLTKQSKILNPKSRERYALEALDYAQKQGDLIHTLAHLVDLEKIYKQNGETNKYTRTLLKKERILISICSDYEGAKNKHKTYSKDCSPLNRYEIELAKTRVEIAKKVYRKNPKLAEAILKKAQKTFEQQGRQKEVDFVKLILSEISW